VLYLIPAALELLRPLADRHPTGPPLRNRVGKPWSQSAVGMAMRKAAQKAGLPGKIAYGYRHTWATDALAAGVPDAVVAEMLVHSSTAMLHRHYSHLATRGKLLAEAARKVRG
jgi:integrase